MTKKKTVEKTPAKRAKSTQVEKKTSQFESVRDMIGLVSAGAGIFTALLYLTGRSYASGYFKAMNIPNYQVDFSIWEYGEVAWLPMLLYPAAIIIISSILFDPLQKTEGWISKKLVEIIKIIRKRLKQNGVKPSEKNNSSLLAQAKNSIPTFLTLIFLTTVILLSASQLGFTNGRLYVLLSSPRAEIVSEKQLSVGVIPEPIGKNAPFVYKGLHLLVANNGKYYLFKELDPKTCRPLKVYVIDSSQLVQINLLSSSPVTSQCENEEALKLPFQNGFIQIGLKGKTP